jgi:GT2 family glycosyltransferase
VHTVGQGRETCPVDVVVVTYNSSDDLGACLASIGAVERVIVVDNCSSDGSVAIAEAFGADVVRSDRNIGFGAAANRGAARGAADVILFLNPDARLQPGAVAALAGAVEAPDVAVAGGQLVDDELRPLRSWFPIPSPANTWAEALGLRRLFRRRPSPAGDVPSVVGAAMAIRREVFDALEGFDPRFWLYGEETELCARCTDRGWRVRVVDDAVVVHPGGASGRPIHPVVFEHFHLAGELIIEKRHGRAAVLSHRIGALTGASLHVLANAVRGRWRHADTYRWRRVAARQARLLLSSPTRPDADGARRLRELQAGA